MKQLTVNERLTNFLHEKDAVLVGKDGVFYDGKNYEKVDRIEALVQSEFGVDVSAKLITDILKEMKSEDEKAKREEESAKGVSKMKKQIVLDMLNRKDNPFMTAYPGDKRTERIIYLIINKDTSTVKFIGYPDKETIKEVILHRYSIGDKWFVDLYNKIEQFKESGLTFTALEAGDLIRFHLMDDFTAKKWLLNDKIKTLSYNKDEWNYIYINPTRFGEELPCPPTWKIFTSCVEYEEEFKELFFTYFRPKPSRQSIWLYGSGFDGKSTLLGVMERFFNQHNENVFSPIQPNQTKKEFAYSSVFGSHVISIPDVKKDLDIVQHDFCHHVTGGDTISVEYKGKGAFKARMRSNLIFTANAAPVVDYTADNESTRVVPFQMERSIDPFAKDIKDNPKYVADFEDKLYNELEDFVIHCKYFFDKLNAGDDNSPMIRIPDDFRQELNASTKSEDQAYAEEMFEELIVLDPDYYIQRSHMRELFGYISQTSNGIIKNSNQTQGKLKNGLISFFKCSEKKIKGKMVYPGIKFKNLALKDPRTQNFLKIENCKFDGTLEQYNEKQQFEDVKNKFIDIDVEEETPVVTNTDVYDDDDYNEEDFFKAFGGR